MRTTGGAGQYDKSARVLLHDLMGVLTVSKELGDLGIGDTLRDESPKVERHVVAPDTNCDCRSDSSANSGP